MTSACSHVLQVFTDKWRGAYFYSQNNIIIIMKKFTCINIYIYISPNGGLVVSMLASGTQDRGFDPG